MCGYSGGNHAFGCPNAPEPPKIYECKLCDYGIREGDEYIDVGNGYICKDCAESNRIIDIMETQGWELSAAEKN